jgi:hypothetical protein
MISERLTGEELDRQDELSVEEVLASAEAWLTRWASHVGGCRGGGFCTCGLTAIRFEVASARSLRHGARPTSTRREGTND